MKTNISIKHLHGNRNAGALTPPDNGNEGRSLIPFCAKATGLCLLSLLFIPAGSVAQDVRFSDVHVAQNGEFMTLGLTVNLDSLKLGTNRQLIFTPQLRTEGDTLCFPQIVVNGRRQQIMYERGVKQHFTNAAKVVERTNGKKQQIGYQATVPLSAVLRNYDIVVHEDHCGCGDLTDGNDMGIYRKRKPFITFVHPKAESRKERSLDKRAYIDFPVNRTELHPDYRRNPIELDSIIRTINLLKDDPNLSVSKIEIHGFASPESPYTHNDYLARNRAKTLKDHVRRMVNLPDEIFSVAHTAEDWDGLVQFITGSNLEHKEEIAAIASDGSLDPDTREQKIRSLYPDEYRFMLSTWYPALRHSDYHITYVVKPFSVEQAKTLIHTKPQQLSQEEMFLVAKTCKPGSEEFNEIMEIAVRMFPDNADANLNAACTRLEAGDAIGAEAYLKKAGDSPDAINARGVCCLLKGDTEEACRLFRKAGTPDAKKNLENEEQTTRNIK